MPRLKLITLNGSLFDDDVYEVYLPTVDGDIAVYQGHAPLLAVAGRGIVSVRRKKSDREHERDYYAIYGGTIEVLNNIVSVLVDEADAAASVNEAEAKEAHARAEQLVKDAKDQVSLNRAQVLLENQRVRLKLAELHRRKQRR